MVADEYDRFITIVRKSWNTVKDELKLSVDTWSRFTDEKQWQLLESFGLKEPAQQQVLAREINKLLGITREWRVQDGGSATPTPQAARSCARVWRVCSLEGGGGTCGALHTWACIPPV